VHFEPQLPIAVAFVRDESLPLAGWPLQRQVVNSLDVAPAFRIHGLAIVAGILICIVGSAGFCEADRKGTSQGTSLSSNLRVVHRRGPIADHNEPEQEHAIIKLSPPAILLSPVAV
jgi:hypothetical protein